MGLAPEKDKELDPEQKHWVANLKRAWMLLKLFEGESFEDVSVKEFWSRKTTNSYGEECHVARKIGWANLMRSLPAKGFAGAILGADVCRRGDKDFLLDPWK